MARPVNKTPKFLTWTQTASSQGAQSCGRAVQDGMYRDSLITSMSMYGVGHDMGEHGSGHKSSSDIRGHDDMAMYGAGHKSLPRERESLRTLLGQNVY